MPQLQSKKSRKEILETARSAGRGSLSALISILMVLGLTGGFYLYRQNIMDWLALRSYQAPVAIQQLADQGSMTPYARKVFYVNKPVLEKKDAFAKDCPDATREQTIVLGCYHGNQGGIFLFDVDDPRLEGVEQVTAAHEMLHATYDRLNPEERAEIDAMLTAFYETGLKDERIKKTIDAYRKTEPNDIPNEMHSIFGTEVASLPAELEEYYKQYFISRTAVTDLSNRYQAEFTSRQQKIDSYDAQLESLKTRIDTNKTRIDNQQQEISSQKEELDRLRSNNAISQYNSGVARYNNSVDDYNSTVSETKGLITQYNELVARRNAVAVEQETLVGELKGDMKALKE